MRSLTAFLAQGVKNLVPQGNRPVRLGDFGTPGRLGFEVLGLGFEDLRLGFENLVLGFEDGGLGFEVLPEERGVLSREAGWPEGVREPGARFARLGGCSRTWWGNTCRWGYGIPLAHCMLLSCPHWLPPRPPAANGYKYAPTSTKLNRHI